MDAYIQCPACLGIEHLREALVDPCPECDLMYFEVIGNKDRQYLNLKFKIHQHWPEPRFILVVSIYFKKETNQFYISSTTLSHLSNAVQGIQALLAMSGPSATQNVNEEMRGSVSTSSLPRINPAAECSMEETLCL